MHKRNRFGVVTNPGRTIKDFYIFPLAADQDPHPSLLPFNGVGLEEKRARPNYLLGLLVKKSKHTASLNHQQHSKQEHVDRSAHYSPNYSSSAKASALTTTPPRNESKSQKRSYTPPPPAGNSSSYDVSYTPPRKEKYQDEPYDPEEGLDFRLTKRQKKEHRHSIRPLEDAADAQANERTVEPAAQPAAQHVSPTKNLANLLEYLSKTGKLSEKGSSSTILNEIAKISSSEEQQLLLKELKRKVEESERQLEIKRRAAENAFSQATSSNNFDSNCIPGLDGDFSSITDTRETEEISSIAPNDLEIPDSWKVIIEKYSNNEETSKPSEYSLISLKSLFCLFDY